MTRAEIEEEIRAHLREAQVATVDRPWHFDSDDFTPLIRSALRHLLIAYQSVLITAKPSGVMGTDGIFTTDPGDIEGLVIAHYVAAQLIRGELTQKLMDGELGVIFRTGSDYMDTTQAATRFKEAADDIQSEYDAMLAICLASLDQGSLSVFGIAGLATDKGIQA